jgi:hypothetical protein
LLDEPALRDEPKGLLWVMSVAAIAAKFQQWSLFPESGPDFKAFRHARQARPPLQPKEYDHARHCQFLAARPWADTLEQRKADWSQAAAAAEARLGDPDQAPNRPANA